MVSNIRITGTVLEQAVVRHTVGTPPSAHLVLRMVTGVGITWGIKVDCGCSPAQLIAAGHKAHALRAGAACQVYARGARISTTPQGDPQLVALEVSDVIPLGIKSHATGDQS